MNNMQENREYRICGDRDKTVNHIISEGSKLAQKEYKSRHDWVGKVIHWELCKKLKLHHTNKWYMQKLSLKMTRPHFSYQERKKTWQFTPVNLIVKMKENKKLDKYMDRTIEMKKL